MPPLPLRLPPPPAPLPLPFAGTWPPNPSHPPRREQMQTCQWCHQSCHRRPCQHHSIEVERCWSLPAFIFFAVRTTPRNSVHIDMRIGVQSGQQYVPSLGPNLWPSLPPAPSCPCPSRPHPPPLYELTAWCGLPANFFDGRPSNTPPQWQCETCKQPVGCYVSERRGDPLHWNHERGRCRPNRGPPGSPLWKGLLWK